jgi:enamine deaminase RidA (YjgF/YER057c/UK114 family)
MSSPQRHGVGPTMSQAVVHGNTVYLAGQVARDGSTDIAGQTRDVLRQIDALLAEVGSDRSRLLSVNVWLTDMADFAAMNEVWNAWIDGVAPPARATVQSPLAGSEWLVEMMAVAAL